MKTVPVCVRYTSIQIEWINKLSLRIFIFIWKNINILLCVSSPISDESQIDHCFVRLFPKSEKNLVSLALLAFSDALCRQKSIILFCLTENYFGWVIRWPWWKLIMGKIAFSSQTVLVLLEKRSWLCFDNTIETLKKNWQQINNTIEIKTIEKKTGNNTLDCGHLQFRYCIIMKGHARCARYEFDDGFFLCVCVYQFLIASYKFCDYGMCKHCYANNARE